MNSGQSLSDDIRNELASLIEKIPPDDRARTCLEIELALVEPGFDGIPLGSTLTDLLSALVYRRSGSAGTRRDWRRFISYHSHMLRGIEPPSRFRPETPVGEAGGRVVLALISQRAYHADWVPVFLQELGLRRCRLVAQEVGFNLPEGTSVLRWKDMPTLSMRTWRRSFRRVAQSWRASLSRLRGAGAIDGAAERSFFHGLLVSSQRIRRCGEFLRRCRPSAVVVEYDRNVRGSCLVLAARALGIPTFTLVHGVINGPFGYTPVLADCILCWGEFQKRQLMEYGTPAHRVETVGFERLEPAIRADRGLARSGLGLPDVAAVAVLATNPIRPSERLKLARVFCEALERAAGVSGLVRLHPSEKLETYDAVRKAFPDVRFVANDEFSQDEILAAADVVVVHSSGFGSEAMAKGRCCVVLDAIEAPLGHGRDLIELGGAPRADSAEELAAILEKFRSDPGFRTGLDRCRERFVRRMFAAFGKEAVSNIANVVLGKAEVSRGSVGPTGRPKEAM